MSFGEEKGNLCLVHCSIKTLACIQKKIPVHLDLVMNFSCPVYSLKESYFKLLVSDSLNLHMFLS